MYSKDTGIDIKGLSFPKLDNSLSNTKKMIVRKFNKLSEKNSQYSKRQARRKGNGPPD